MAAEKGLLYFCFVLGAATNWLVCFSFGRLISVFLCFHLDKMHRHIFSYEVYEVQQLSAKLNEIWIKSKIKLTCDLVFFNYRNRLRETLHIFYLL